MTYESLGIWIAENILDYEDKIKANEYKNDSQKDEDIKFIKDGIKKDMEKRGVKGSEGKLRGAEKVVDKFIELEINDAIKQNNEDYLTNTTNKIKETENLQELKEIKIDREYNPETISNIEFEQTSKGNEFGESLIISIRESNTREEIEELIKQSSGTKYRTSIGKEGNKRISYLERVGRIS